MSHIPLRDNPDCASLPDDVYDRLAPLGDLIDQSHGRSYHQSECSQYCTDPECRILRDALLGSTPSTEDVLGWLVAQGLLDLAAVERFAAKDAPTPTPSAKDWGVAWFGRNAQNGTCHRCQRADRVYQGYNGGAHMGLFCAACKEPVLRGEA